MVLRSMTGFGTGVAEDGPRRAVVELRTVNHRYLKVSARLPRIAHPLESDIEAQTRKHLRRGAVTVQVRYTDTVAPSVAAIDEGAVRAYAHTLAKLRSALGLGDNGEDLRTILSLPGVLQSPDDESEGLRDEVKILVMAALDRALEDVNRAREAEGAQLRNILLEHARVLEHALAAVELRATDLPRTLRDRMVQRVRSLLQDLDPGAELAEAQLHREICLLADRTDIAEEVHRLRSHLARYREILDRGVEAGKALEFLTQEMLREANTIGSKANEAEIAHHVVEMKCEIERMKEQVQNVE